MSTRTIRGGSFRETFSNTGAPNKDNSKTPHPKVQSGQCRTFVKVDIAGVRKQTVVSAVLRGRVKDAWPAQTLTVTPVDEKMTLRQVTANNLPALRSGQAVAQAQGAKSDGEYVEVPVTAWLQTIADGATNLGLQITTSNGGVNRFYGTESKHKNQTWQLVYEIAEAPDAPTQLTPNGGFVSTPKPVLASAFRDPGGESKTLAALQVQIGTTAGSVFTSTWDSGEVATTKPRLALTSTFYPGAADGTTPKWRMRHKDGAGYWSEWSDVAEFTYDIPPNIVVTNPSGGLVYDRTPTFAFEVDSGTIAAWRLQILNKRRTKILHDSRKRDGEDASSIAYRIPFRDTAYRRKVLQSKREPGDNPETTEILEDDRTYWLRIRVWDRTDRIPTTGQPAYVEEWVEFGVDDDIAAEVPVDVSAVQVGDTPRVQLTWRMPGGYSEGFAIRRNGETVERLDLDDDGLDVDGDTYTYVYDGAQPFRANRFTIKSIINANQSTPSASASVEPAVEGVWLLGEDSEVCFAGVDVDGFNAKDKRVRHELLNMPYDVDIVYGPRGVEGSYTGSFSDRLEWEDIVAAVMALRAEPEAVLRLVWGTRSVPVWASIDQPMPTADMLPGYMEHRVSFTVQQAGEFEVS